MTMKFQLNLLFLFEPFLTQKQAFSQEKKNNFDHVYFFIRNQLLLFLGSIMIQILVFL